MGFDAIDQGEAFVLAAFSIHTHTHIAVAQIRHGADDGRGFALAVFQHQHFFVYGLGCRTDDVYIQSKQQGFGRVQKAGGIVVATDDDDVATQAIRRHLCQKAVIQFLRGMVGGDGVKHIARNHQHIHPLLLQRLHEPI